jgi:hypothetical protein
MKTLKITAIALFMVVTNALCAQSEVKELSIEERVKAETTELVNKLNLTPAQEKTVSNAALDRAKQMEADKEKYKGDKEGLKTARKTSNTTFETSVKNLLTPDQKTKYEQMLKEKL